MIIQVLPASQAIHSSKETDNMTPKKLSIFFGFPSYGGNGGISCEVPDIRKWWGRIVQQCGKDERISAVYEETIGDTPVTMVRNKFVTLARAWAYTHGCERL